MIIDQSALKKVAIAFHNQSSFFEQNYEYIPFLNVDVRNTIQNDSVKVFVPTYDFSDPIKFSSLNTTAKDPSNYYLGIVNDLKINPINVFKPVDTFTYSDFAVQAQNKVIKTEGSISIPVLFPFVTTDFNSYFLEIIWKLGVYVFVPFFINTDLSPKNIGGPLFVKKYNISVNENSPTTLTIDFIGGVSILPPSPYQDNNLLYTQSFPSIGTSATDVNYFTYRTGKHFDCLFTTPVNDQLNVGAGNTSIYSSYFGTANYFAGNNINVASMSLTIENELVDSYTANYFFSDVAFDGENFIDTSNTIKIISLKKRKVTGTIVFISSSNLAEAFDTAKIQQLAVYFGGPFYFPMNNVAIEVFGSELEGEKGYYTHTLNFKASLQESKYKSYYLQNEFDIKHSGLYDTPSGSIYVEPQDPL